MSPMVESLVAIMRNVGPTVAELIFRLVTEIASSDNPERTAKRLLKQGSIEVATEATVRKAYRGKGKGA